MKKYLISLKTYAAAFFVATFCAITMISASLVLFAFWLFEVNVGLFWGVAAVCAISMAIGGTLFYFNTAYFLRYVSRFILAVTSIANGDFSVRVRRKRHKGEFIYLHELDELAHNINKMASELEKMNFMQKDFIANVSHELKTPLSVISGYCEILLDEPKEADKKRYLELIRTEACALSELCENMLTLSRLENQAITPCSDVARIDEQLRKALSLLMQKRGERKFELDLKPVSLRTNALMLMQVWLNLLDNALKYSKSEISAECFEKDGEIIVRIKDDGAGIEAGKLDRIFDKFYQCDESHKSLGSGLGLSIVREILTLLKGEIYYESKPGEGTKVSVTLPKDANLAQNTKEHTQDTLG